MFGLALRSLRFRTGSLVASFLSMFLGATMVMAFASMLDTSMGDGVPTASGETLSIMGNVVGGWALILVIFAVTSTLTLSVRQRATEMALLKSIGATPAQIGRMIVGESAVVALVAAVLAMPVAVLGGNALLEMLISTDQVADGVSYAFGPVAISMGFGITVGGSMIAALLTARRTTRMRVADSLLDASTGEARMGKVRVIAALVFLACGLNLGILTATVMGAEDFEAMQTAGPASIVSSIGMALLGPLLVRRVTAVLAWPLERMAGVSGYLTVQNIRQRTNQMATALMPIILFTGIATGTLYMQDIDNAAAAATGVARTAEQKSAETLNLVVIGMIALFACIMLINTLVAATTYRRREFGGQRLVGATRGQVLRMVTFEGIALAATGVLFGGIASLVTVLPYSIAMTDTVVPDSPIWIFTGIVAVAVTVTLAAGVGTARRVVRTPAIEAVAA
ncbi:ABC transporter permease [Actinomadura sp. HBU206391]|uniref:ABC transporter permease n=1 Tax=Actinomadura sp. HBU206391 TaxID=2731692 RepID=UPI00165097DE|nr:FtsX-like permease family protein [Actinomadura sp. HBU206391]MBC6460570.1 FtsX-like permease family protein [Actinomadura sp. HBU206391]